MWRLARRCYYNSMQKSRGFTMIEVLIVIATLALLVTAGMFYIYPNMARGRDGKRMSDLSKIKIAFEDYYNDNECYPPITTLESYCGGTPNGALDPYMQSVPCDPKDRTPYVYKIVGTANGSCGGPTKGYQVYANLERDGSEASKALNCDGETGCGVGDGSGLVYYDYGVSEGTAVSIIDAPPDVVRGATDPPPSETNPPSEEPQAPVLDWCCVNPTAVCVDMVANPGVSCFGDYHGEGGQSACISSCHVPAN